MDEYINKNSLRNSVCESLEENPHDDHKIYQNHIYEHLHFLNLIDREPVENVAPVRHGKWIMDDNENPYIRICSVCRYSRPMMNDHGFYCKTNYCPTCGAKMDLKEYQ